MKIREEMLERLIECRDITTLKPEKLEDLFRAERRIADFLPEQEAAFDPRSREYVIFNSRRAARPADNKTVNKTPGNDCVICAGRTTGIVDIQKLGNGYTFINKNLFPIFYPFGGNNGGGQASGFHFLQWTSSSHSDDWTNMNIRDLEIVMARLAALEGCLLSNTGAFFPAEKEGWVSIIKNYGKKVGGSMEHDHQQIGLSSVMPGRVRQNIGFYKRTGTKFNEYVMKSNPENLLLHDYGPIQLVVPRFMKRPLNMMLIVKDAGKDFLHELDSDEIHAVAAAWSDAVSVIMRVMPGTGREPAFNIITNTGSGIYFEFLPYTQEFGGFEQMGLYLCQMTPEQAFTILKTAIDNRRGNAT